MSMESFVYEMSLRLSRETYWILWCIPVHKEGIKLIINHHDQIMERYYRNFEVTEIGGQK